MLNRDFNASFGKFLFPFIKIAFVLVFVISFYASVRLYTVMNVSSYILVIMIESGNFVFFVPITVLVSSIFDIATQFSRQLSPTIQRIPGRITKRICVAKLKSCAVIRFQVGNLYCMEAQAKLTLMGHLVNGIVFLVVNVSYSKS